MTSAQITGDAVWTEYNINIQSNYIVSKHQYWTANDTVIHGLTYTKIADKDRYLGAIREENGKVYAYLNYGDYMAMEDEFLLYDFTVEVGDVITSTAFEGALSYSDGITVRQTDEITLENGEKRKRIFFDKTGPWIEGIGSTGGLFHDTMWLLTNYTISYLTCFQQNNISLYLDTDKCLDGKCCEKLSDGANVHNLSFTNEIVIFPNPTQGIVTIILPDNNRSRNAVKVFDGTGTIIQTWFLRENELKLDLSTYPSGVYSAMIDIGNSMQSYKIIKQ
jgi:hypothetical protein